MAEGGHGGLHKESGTHEHGSGFKIVSNTIEQGANMADKLFMPLVTSTTADQAFKAGVDLTAGTVGYITSAGNAPESVGGGGGGGDAKKGGGDHHHH